MVKISVVIPAYNVENYIIEAVNSVLAQTSLPHEVIIIDDGSTDQTADKLDIYARNPIVRIFHTENCGLGPTRNYGIEKSTGEYIYFFDADDRLERNFIKNILKIIRENEAPDIIFFSGMSFLDKNFYTTYCPNYERNIEGIFRHINHPICAMQEKKSFYSSACLYVSKKQLWQLNSLKFKNIVHEDEELIFPLASSAKTIFVTKNIYFYRRLRKNSIMTSARSQKNVDAYIVIIKSLLEYYKKHKSYDYFDALAHKRRLRKFVAKYVTESVQLSSNIDFLFLINVALSGRDAKIIPIWVLNYIRAKKKICLF